MFGFVEIVRREEHRDAVVAQCFDQIPRLPACCGVKTGGDLWCLGVSVDPVQIGTDTNWLRAVVKSVISGTAITLLAIKDDGTLWDFPAMTVSNQVGAGMTWKDVQSGNMQTRHAVRWSSQSRPSKQP